MDDERLRKQLDDADRLNGELLHVIKGQYDAIDQLYTDIRKMQPLYLWEPDEHVRVAMVRAHKLLLDARLIEDTPCSGCNNTDCRG